MPEKLVTRPPLPAGKTELEAPGERQAVWNHSMIMYRDSAVKVVEAYVMRAAAIYNINEFKLFRELGFDTFEQFCEGGLKLSRMHANRYRQIGEGLSDYLGGGVITMQMITDRVPAHVLKGKVTLEMLETLSKAEDGMTKLLTTKSDAEVQDVLDPFVHTVKTKHQRESRTSDKRLAFSKKYTDMNPPTQSDLTMLLDGAERSCEKNNQLLRKLRNAAQSYPNPDLLAKGSKYPARAARVYAKMRETIELYLALSEVIPDPYIKAEIAKYIIGGAVPPEEKDAAIAMHDRAQEPNDPFFEQTIAGREPVHIPVQEVQSEGLDWQKDMGITP